MSTSKGNPVRRRPQKHQNRTAFKNDLHDTSKKTKFLNSLEVPGVCERCKHIIDWKIKYKKYKVLTAPKKCVSCEQKTVKYAYHIMCKSCTSQKNVCAKCCKPIEIVEIPDEKSDIDIEAKLKGLSERKRRTVLRYLNKQQSGDQLTSNKQLDDIMASLGNVDLDDDFSLGFSDEEEESDEESDTA